MMENGELMWASRERERVEITEFMIILNSSAAVKSFMAKGSLTL